MSRLRLFSLEDDQSSGAEQETEITLYARITNFDGLKSAKHFEEQIQVESRLGQDNHCRVRKTIKDGQTAYRFTFKIKNGNHANVIDSRREQNLDVDESFFNDFYSVADKVQDKIRYFFDSETITLSYRDHDEDREIAVPNIVYEVDVFKKPDGSFSEYCKIDIEVDNILTFMEHNYPDIKDIKLNVKISSLPFNPVDGIVNDKDNETARSFIQHLYDVNFCTDLVKQREEMGKNE